jgi:flotillin
MTLAIVFAGIGLLLALVTIVTLKRMIYICPPNELLVFAGTHRKAGNRSVGYRLVQGGRAVRIPLIEKVYRMDLTNMIIDIHVQGAYSKGGIPLNVTGVANLKIASTEPAIGNAIERFLHFSREQIMKVARDTLEGNLRGVLATLTPEEVNNDRVKFAESLLHEADHDLERLGLELDTLKIQSVSDDKGYLDSLGRRQSAELVMRSRVAEAENRALAAERAAENLTTQELTRIDADMATARADAERRILEATTRKGALVAEHQAAVAAQVAKATAELEVQTARLEQVRLKLEADRVRPAAARRDQMIEQARAGSARIVEDGKAAATALERMSATWERNGEAARQIVVAQKLAPLVGKLMETVRDLHIERMTVIDGGLAAGTGPVAAKSAVLSEQIKQATGVDVPAILRKIAT